MIFNTSKYLREPVFYTFIEGRLSYPDYFSGLLFCYATGLNKFSF